MHCAGLQMGFLHISQGLTQYDDSEISDNCSPAHSAQQQRGKSGRVRHIPVRHALYVSTIVCIKVYLFILDMGFTTIVCWGRGGSDS